MLISVLWGVFFSETLINKWRYFPRVVLFSISLIALLAVSLLAFTAIPEQWATLWLLVTCVLVIGVVVLSFISELYFKPTGKRYTKALQDYKKHML